MDPLISLIKKRINGNLPGRKVQLEMAPAMKRLPELKSGFRKAAVLLLVYPGKKGLNLVFILRTSYDGPHSGQISFPGGEVKTEDKDLYDTALRECHEETGILIQDIVKLGDLTEIHIPVSNFLVSPFVGYLDYPPDFLADPKEVEQVITIPVDWLKDSSSRRKEIRFIQGQPVEIPFFIFSGHKIWGATAMILNEFLALTEQSGPTQQVHSG